MMIVKEKCAAPPDLPHFGTRTADFSAITFGAAAEVPRIAVL
jgi:hypothetical protein